MEAFHSPWISFVLLALFSFLSNPSTVLCREAPNHNTNQLETYIIQVQKPTAILDEESLTIWYKSFLPESEDNSKRLLHSYSEVFGGFSARLKEEELNSVAKKEGFLRAYRNRVLPLLTTHTPDFLGLRVGQGLWKVSSLGEGVIIGLLDTGLTPNHPSFDDDGVPPPPAKWKGSCHFTSGCNNKLIGAKNMVASMDGSPPIDTIGHGTHTSGTAAGNFVRNASAYGLAVGTAAGVAPHAHLAIYQVCTEEGCSQADILAGLDTAVKDGVDVLSLSLGGTSIPFDQDPLAIGAFGAVEKGLFVSCAGGNSGPEDGTLSNEAPWILTVAASTIDRSLRATVKLGDGQEIDGESIDQSPTFARSSLTLVYSQDSPTCVELTEDVKGKVVVCESGGSPSSDTARFVKDAGGVAVIFINANVQGYTLLHRRCNFPTVFVSNKDGDIIRSYATSVSEPTASIIFNGTVLGASPAPVVAYFSSRGPSTASPGIIKPDVTGPGVNILAAWMSSVDGTKGKKTFNIISGTSMATPHLSGVAALVKSLHPNWSPAAIKSAILTTSDDKGRDGEPIQDELHNPASFFAMGAGHVNPSKAADPGLVYDLGIDDYIAYICGLYGSSGASAIVRGKPVDCANFDNITEAELNYPSILLVPQDGTAVAVKRTVTNVGPASSSYKVEVKVPKTASVTVEPPTLEFSKVNEKKSFAVSAKWIGSPPSASAHVAGNLRWVSDKHVVRSPILISGPTASN